MKIDPFDGAKLRLSRRGKEAPLRVNPDPSAILRALSLSKGKPRPSVQGVEGLTFGIN